MYFLFTFPLWPLFLFLFLALIGAGVIVEWITQHILIISVVAWLTTFLFAVLLPKKGKKACTVSIVSLFIAPYIALVSCFFDIVSALNRGDLFILVVNLFGIIGGLISALPSLGVFLLEDKYLISHDKWSIGITVLNFVIAFIMSIFYYQIGFGNL